MHTRTHTYVRLVIGRTFPVPRGKRKELMIKTSVVDTAQ